MKKFLGIFVLLLSQFYFAQKDIVVNYLAENWGVNKDVVKIEEVKYSQGFTSGKFEPRDSRVYIFKNGNQTMVSDMTTNFDSHYIYGKSGAIIKSKKTEYDDFDFDIVNYFEFSEITYQDGTKEGSRSFDKEYAKFFNMSVLSYDAIDDLK